MATNYHIIPATTPHHLTAARTLFTAYATWLNIDLTFQNFQAELSSLPGKYSPQEGGDLLLAYSSSADPSPLGCVALRPLPDKDDERQQRQQRQLCEVKRLLSGPKPVQEHYLPRHFGLPATSNVEEQHLHVGKRETVKILLVERFLCGDVIYLARVLISKVVYALIVVPRVAA
ncbi:uncharacterized protein An01g10570 [Aspergillus niger]|uniref:Contig An01c0330, genomic contig n=2 Tax=Aspergillus niger TaxID=5061 RepID=A2QA86_ASPNC|nr:uncharacterized protein An01g10570 [Aspergillus niger]CAK37238.1 unnamed protein product [Aspergillus niger]